MDAVAEVADYLQIPAFLCRQTDLLLAAAATGPLWFQLYCYKDRGLTQHLVERARAAGYRALVLTADTPLVGRRERDIRNRFTLPPGMGWKNVETAGLRDLPQGVDGSLKPMVLLFRNQVLIDATPPARALLDRISAPEGEWTRLLQWIGPRFPDAIEGMSRIDRTGRFECLGQSGTGSAALRLVADWVASVGAHRAEVG